MLLASLVWLRTDFFDPASCALHRPGGLSGEPVSGRGLAAGQPGSPGSPRLFWRTEVGDVSGASQLVALPTAVCRGCRSRAERQGGFSRP